MAGLEVGESAARGPAGEQFGAGKPPHRSNDRPGRDRETHGSRKGCLRASSNSTVGISEKCPDLPRSIASLGRHYKDPRTADVSARLVRIQDDVRFASGKYPGQPLNAIARLEPGFWNGSSRRTSWKSRKPWCGMP